jgi:hypothetical protein
MKNNNFTYSFDSSKSQNEIFQTLLNVRKWWSGFYDEKFTGASEKINDEFTFLAGEGVHFTKQRLIEMIPGKKIAWIVTESNLSFAEKTDEWTNTKLIFDIEKYGDKTKITFTHEGLVPQFDCYEACSNGWSQYLQKLASDLK